jgi:septum formation protein
LLGLKFDVLASKLPEVVTENIPEKVVEELSRQKAEDVYRIIKSETKEPFLVIGADTIVSVDGEILGKPKDEEDAFRILKQLQGRTHQVYTGVTLVYAAQGCGRGLNKKCNTDNGKKNSATNDTFTQNEENNGILESTFNMCTDVTFYPVSDEEITDYISTGDPMDKAGAYGIQSGGARFVKEISGDYNNVVGLPVSRLYQELKKIGVLDRYDIMNILCPGF